MTKFQYLELIPISNKKNAPDKPVIFALSLTRMRQEKYSKRLQFLFTLGAVWLLLVAMLEGLLWPDLPKTNLGWIILVVLGPPAYIVGESFFGWLFSEKHGKAISSKQFSWASDRSRICSCRSSSWYRPLCFVSIEIMRCDPNQLFLRIA